MDTTTEWTLKFYGGLTELKSFIHVHSQTVCGLPNFNGTIPGPVSHEQIAILSFYESQNLCYMITK